MKLLGTHGTYHLRRILTSIKLHKWDWPRTLHYHSQDASFPKSPAGYRLPVVDGVDRPTAKSPFPRLFASRYDVVHDPLHTTMDVCAAARHHVVRRTDHRCRIPTCASSVMKSCLVNILPALLRNVGCISWFCPAPVKYPLFLAHPRLSTALSSMARCV